MNSYDDVTSRIIEYPAKHLRVLGPPGSGKTGLVIDRYRTLTGGGSKVFILTYSREQLKRITRDVLAPGTAHAGMSPVLTHFTLAREILDASGRPVPRIVEGMEELLLVRQVVRKHANKFTSDYKNIRNSERFQRDLLGLFHLLLQNHIKEDRLAGLKAAVASARLADALALYELYLSGLSDGDRATFYDLSWRACDRVTSLPDTHPFREAGVWLVDDFQDIDAGQFALLTALLPGDGVAVNVFGDPMGSFFGFRGTHARYLMREFPERYPCETLPLTGGCLKPGPLAEALETLTGEILGDAAKDYLPLRPLDPTPSAPAAHKPLQSLGPLFDPPVANNAGGGESTVAEVQLEVTADEVDEAYTAAARVHELIAAERYRPHEIAVVANDKHRYEPLLRAAFEQRGLPLDTGRPPQGAFRRFAHAFLTLLESPSDPVAMAALTTSPFYPHFRTRGLEMKSRAVDPGRDRDAVRAHVESAADEMRSSEVGERMMLLVQRSFLPACETYHTETEDESVYAFLSLLTRHWEEYAQALEAAHGRASFGEFIRISGLFSTRSHTAMPSAEEVGFYSCREVKGRSFAAVIVLGCSELLFPSVMKRDGLVPAAALQEAFKKIKPDGSIDVHGARSPEQHLQAEHHLMYLALTRAHGALYLSAPKMFSGQARPAPASVLARAWPKSEYRRTMADQRTPPQIRFARAWAHGVASEELATPLGALNRIGPLWHAAAPEALPFAIEKFTLSQSSFGSYFQCPRRFFYRRVLGLPDDAGVAARLGGIFHDVMAEVGRTFNSGTELHDGITDAFIYKTIDGEFEKDPAILSDSLTGKALRHHLYVAVKAAVRLDRRESGNYTVKNIEENFDFSYGGFEFRGRRDRAEVSETGGVTLIDFKTGSFAKTADNLRKKICRAADDPDKANWQVPFYVWGFRDDTKKWPETFKHVVLPVREEAFSVTLHICDREEDAPPGAEKKRSAIHYVLRGEIEDAMQQAVLHAKKIFAQRTEFERVEIGSKQCVYCPYNRACRRSEKWN